MKKKEANDVQKEIQTLKKVCATKTRGLKGLLTEELKAKQNADDLIKKKAELEQQRKELEQAALEKEKVRDKKCKTIGNYVHESVPINDNEVL